jgi:hypothetical protein
MEVWILTCRSPMLSFRLTRTLASQLIGHLPRSATRVSPCQQVPPCACACSLSRPFRVTSLQWFWDKIEFANAVSMEFKDVHPVRREGDDLVLRFRVSGQFVEVMELQEFPFDVQALTFSIQLNCRTTGPMPVRFGVPSDLETSIDSEGMALISLEYERLGGMVVEATEVERAKGRTFPTLRVSMMLKRRPVSVLINCALPMGIFAFLSGLQFLIPVSDQGTRLEVTLNLILTTAAYKYAISTMTPDVPYLTILDKYSLAVFFFITVMTVEAAVLGYFAVSDKYYAPGSDSQKLIDFIDWVMLLVSVIGFFLYHVYFCWRTVGNGWQRRRLAQAISHVQQESITMQRYPSLIRKVSAELANNVTDTVCNAVGDVSRRAKGRRAVPKNKVLPNGGASR